VKQYPEGSFGSKEALWPASQNRCGQENEEKDLDAVVAIDTKVLANQDGITGWGNEPSRGTFAHCFSGGGSGREGGRLHSRDASGYEYDVPENIGWIDTIGVDPDYQKRGIARLLMKEMIANPQKGRSRYVYTMVNWPTGTCSSSFTTPRFQKGPLINLELKL